MVTWGRFLELCAIFDHWFSENGFLLLTVSYGAPAGKIFRALGRNITIKRRGGTDFARSTVWQVTVVDST